MSFLPFLRFLFLLLLSFTRTFILHDQPERWQPLFVTGDPLWASYTVSAKVRPLSLTQSAGIVFRYHTNRHYHAFTISGGRKARLSLRLPIEQKIRVVDWKELGSTEVSYDVRQYHELKVENDGPKIRAYFNGKLVIEASDGDILSGRGQPRRQDVVADRTPGSAQHAAHQ